MEAADAAVTGASVAAADAVQARNEAHATLKLIENERLDAEAARKAAREAAELAKAFEQDAENRRARVESVESALTSLRDELARRVGEAEGRLLKAETGARAAGEGARDATKLALEQFDAKTEEALASFKANVEDVAVGQLEQNELLGKQTESIKVEIDKLLQGAVAGKLTEAFAAKHDAAAVTMQRWLYGAATCTALIVAGVGFLVYLALRDTGTDPVRFWLERGSIAVPFLIADWFIIRQYSYYQRLAEEYAFKATMSLTLTPFQERVQSAHGSEKTQEFVVESIRRIYAHPYAAASGDGKGDDPLLVDRALQSLGDIAKEAVSKASGTKG